MSEALLYVGLMTVVAVILLAVGLMARMAGCRGQWQLMATFACCAFLLATSVAWAAS